jgi:nicotinate (nicotinamide) nucleotide adenylyltransferase
MTGRRLVVLFGTSANPPTGAGGHAGLVRWAAGLRGVPGHEGRPVNEVWVLPVFRHAFDAKQALAPFEHRLAMARLAFERLPGLEGRVRVLDVERSLAEATGPGARPGTIDVVRALRAEHPDVDLALLLGGDTYRDLEAGLWKESAALLATTPVVIVPRRGQAEDVPATEGAPALAAVSSSAARASRDEAFLGQVLDPAVLAYVREHGLYAFAGEG